MKITEPSNLRRGLNRTGHDSLQRQSELIGERLNHRVSGLTQRHDEYAGIGMQIVKILTHAQQPALAMHMARETSADRGSARACMKIFARGLAHCCEIEIRDRNRSWRGL